VVVTGGVVEVDVVGMVEAGVVEVVEAAGVVEIVHRSLVQQAELLVRLPSNKARFKLS